MKLYIALVAARVVLTFTTPSAGSYYILRHDTPWSACVIASGHETNACVIGVEVPSATIAGILTLEFYPGNSNPQ